MAAWLLPALISAGSSLLGGVLDRRSAKQQNAVSMSERSDIRRQDRQWFKEDRKSERDYAEDLTTTDRRYAERQRDNERRYAEKVLLDQRGYDRSRDQYRIEVERKALLDDRKYMEGRLSNDRTYMDKKRNEDIAQYSKDRDLMQGRSNKLAEKSASTRGIDFVKLRDDAVKAGYNPMTALSMAHAYSTNVDYQLQGGVYSPGANYTATGPGYSATSGGAGGGVGSSGGGGAAPGAVMGSHMPAAGNFSSPGGGYGSQFNPALSAGSFIKEAMDRAVDSWSNQPVQKDPLADALRNAFEQDQMADQVRDAQIPQGFGYDLTKQEAFQPEATVGVPALASAQAAPTKAKMPLGMVEKGGRKYVPVTLPDGSQSTLEASVARRYDIEPFDALSAGDWEEIRGGVVGEMENTINADQNYDLMTGGNFWPVPPSASDYMKSGRTGQQMFSSWPSN